MRHYFVLAMVILVCAPLIPAQVENGAITGIVTESGSKSGIWQARPSSWKAP
jgi:hypothetical protein